MTLVNGIVSLLAIILNVAQIVVMIYKKKTKVPFEKTLLSLALADAFVSISKFLFLASIYLLLGGIIIITTPWKVIGVFNLMVGFSIYFAMCHSIFIAVQRIYAVFLPIEFRENFTSGICLVSIFAVWVVSLALSALEIFLRNFNGYVYIMLAASGVLILCYTMICCHVRSQRSRVSISTNPQQQNDSTSRTLVYSVLVTAAFLFCTVPHVVNMLIRSDSYFALRITGLMLTLNPVVDSLLYFAFSHMSQKKCCCFPGNAHRAREAETVAITRSSHLELPQIE